MIYLKLTINSLFILLIFSLFGCNKSKPCNTNKSSFNDLYVNTLTSNSNLTDWELIDTEIHAYTFSVTTPQEICAVGYRSLQAISNQKYHIVIIDSLNNNTLLSINENFSPTTTSYIFLSNTVTLSPGILYTINRIQTNWNPYISNTIGRVLTTPNLDSLNFPFSNGTLKIHNSSFYSMGGPAYNIGIPYIDIVFKD